MGKRKKGARPPLEATLGFRLRRARRETGATLKQIAKDAGCSESILSKLENNKVQVSLALLRDICRAVNLTMGELFAPGDISNVLTKAGEREIVKLSRPRLGTDSYLECLIPRNRKSALQGNIHVMPPGAGSLGTITHEGEEVGYILCGIIELNIGGQTYLAQEGDSFHFRSEIPHGYKNVGNTEARILFVNSPPTF